MITIYYIICILYITIISRLPALAHTVRLTTLWSYLDWLKGNWSRGAQILLNIVLFVPLGYLLTKQKTMIWIPIVASLFVSIAIEIIQYLTYRGYFDVDDIISNLIGASVGCLCYRWLGNRLSEWIAYAVVILAGIAGCFIAGRNTQVYETQFDFQITRTEIKEEQITLSGICNIYRRQGLPYQILLKDESEDYLVETNISGDSFTAIGIIPPDGNYEVDVVFQGYKSINTGTFIENGQVTYVKSASVPETNNVDIQKIVGQGALKAYNAEFDVYIYQVEDHLYWIVGSNTDAGMIYQLHTNEPENLPEERKQYGFDNRGFRASDDIKLIHEVNDGRYKVFVDYIPSDYRVTAIMVGMSDRTGIIWREYFRPNRN